MLSTWKADHWALAVCITAGALLCIPVMEHALFLALVRFTVSEYGSR